LEVARDSTGVSHQKQERRESVGDAEEPPNYFL